MRALVAVLILSFVVLVSWLMAANWNEKVTVALGFREARDASLALVIAASVLGGILFIGVLALIEGLTLRVENLRLRRRLKRLEEEVADLRNLALQHAPAPPRLDSGPTSVPDPS
jgi:uncharacterized integral membrane protein